MATRLFTIVSVQNPDLCLGVPQVSAGTDVVLLPTKPDAWMLTTWVVDPQASGLISLAVGGAGRFVLDVEGTNPLPGAILVLNLRDPSRRTQTWTVDGPYISSNAGLEPLVVSGPNENLEAGDPIYWLPKSGVQSQQWRLQPQDDFEALVKQGS